MGRSSTPRRLCAVVASTALCALIVGAPAAVARAPKGTAITDAMLAQRPWLNAQATPQQRAQMLLEQMTLPEKVDLMTGNKGEAPYAFYNVPIVRLGIPALKMADSASGVHAHGWSLPATGEKATAMPSAQALASTWSTDAIVPYARAVTDETRATGHNVLLSPVGDIFRSPWFGRTNESPSEDPIQTARYLGRYTRETQSQNVIVALKHYLAYNQETNRMAAAGQNSIVDNRTLREVYALPYESAIRDSDPGSVMCSFNRVNGDYACESPDMVRGQLKATLGFSGFVMTDYGAAHETAGTLRGGTDMETGLQVAYDGALLHAVTIGAVPEILIDQACYRILFTMFRIGTFDVPSTPYPIDVEADNKVAQSTEEQATTLLKNQSSTLPLTSSAKKITVIGADANVTAIGGGTPFVKAVKTTTPLNGIIERAQSAGATVRWVRGNDQANAANMLEDRDMTAVPSSVLSPSNRQGTGLNAWFWTNTSFQGAPIEQRIAPQVNYDVGLNSTLDTPGPSQVKPPPVSCQTCAGSAVYEGFITAPRSGDYQLALTGFGDATLAIDGQQVATMNGTNERRAYAATPTLLWGQGSTHLLRVTFQGNHPFDVLNGGTVLLQWKTPAGAYSPAIQQAVDAARQSDVAIVYANRIEGESRDRVSLHLPQSDDQLIQAVSAANPNTIVVLANSGPVTMPWLNDVKAVVQTYFGGQAQGAALGRVLWGDVNPSGKLTITYPTSESAVPGGMTSPWDTVDDLNVVYGEGLNVGYKGGYDRAGIDPLFPFGHGLSYTTFGYSNLQVAPTGDATTKPIHVRFKVANTGSRTGAEAAQVYLGLPAPTGEPPKRLVGYDKQEIPAGQTRDFDIVIDPQDSTHPLGYFDTAQNRWTIAAGTYTVYVGGSSRSMPLVGTFTVGAARADAPDAPAANDDGSTTQPATPAPSRADQAARALALTVRMPTTTRATALRKGLRLRITAPTAGRLSATLRSRGRAVASDARIVRRAGAVTITLRTPRHAATTALRGRWLTLTVQLQPSTGAPLRATTGTRLR